jgi:hypothetical protein
MKTYQFAIIAGILLLVAIGVGVQLKGKAKKPCGCKGHIDEATTDVETEE